MKAYQAYKKHHKEDWFGRHILHIGLFTLIMAFIMIALGLFSEFSL